MKINWKSGAIILLICGQTLFSVQAAELQQQGDQAFKSGDYQTATFMYRRALREDQQNPQLLLGVAKSEEILGHIKQAEKFAERAIELDPQTIEAYLVLGRLHGRHGDWEQARHVFQAATVLDPTNALAALGLGEALGRLGEQERASSEFERFKELNALKEEKTK